ncbi:MAG: NERD domain-containing protein [Deltaproteobacteria bacterium]|uniref:nuclease-related domain-containing protein n=1 Tax=Desulfobacula sp. TaxID=2593537 RepID=UPI0019AD1C86|nr:NERD domain-containing protein [Candidatus Desulfobacula maris]MBL6995362.1 NERD domain-containing protein [Desulfobacula sp.]
MFSKELMVTMMPVSIFMFFCLVPVLLILYIFRHQIRKKKSPINIELLRSPGEALRNQIDKSTDDILEYFMYLIIFPVAMYSISITQYSFLNRKPGIIYFILMGSVLFGAIYFLMKKLYKIFQKRNSLRVGYECELAVGQGLQVLAKYGFNIFHDFPAQKNFNIDHIAVGPQGIFAIETKGRAKFQKTEKDNWKLEFDGEKLFFPGWTETKPITQAISQARWLQTWIESSTGDKHYVTPVLAIPGWFIRQTKPSELRITNGKSFDFLAKNKAVLSEKQIMVISFQIEKMCRTVEVKSYNKK